VSGPGNRKGKKCWFTRVAEQRSLRDQREGRGRGRRGHVRRSKRNYFRGKKIREVLRPRPRGKGKNPSGRGTWSEKKGGCQGRPRERREGWDPIRRSLEKKEGVKDFFEKEGEGGGWRIPSEGRAGRRSEKVLAPLSKKTTEEDGIFEKGAKGAGLQKLCFRSRRKPRIKGFSLESSNSERNG